MSKVEKDIVTGTDTTGHEWDGIKELNTPLPRWWLWTFYATVIWSVGYMIAYPSIPLISDATKGMLGYSSRAEVAATIADAKADQAQYLDKIAAMPLADIRKDQDLFQFAVAGGRSSFGVNCAPCHGSGAQGAAGYPNLNDDEWIWGGTLEAIETTLLHGIRYQQDADTRDSQMPAFGRDGVLEREQISDVTAYVLKLAGKDHDAAAAGRGESIYTDNCAACHNDDGTGNTDLGAPALNDAIWLYAGTAAEIAAQISNPRHGVMPGWAGRLDAATIKQLTLYVHSLGGGR